MYLADDEVKKPYSGGSSQPDWVWGTAVGSAILVGLIMSIVVYDLCCRIREGRIQQVSDGGPPSSPTHECFYTVGIRVDEASPSFDARQSMLRIDMLDNLNRYLTTLAVPCFLFKFNQKESKEAQQGAEPSQIDPNPFAGSQKAVASSKNSAGVMPQNVPNQSDIFTKPIHKAVDGSSLNYKSMTAVREAWGNVRQGDLIIFNLKRRHPLGELSSVRLLHDCFAPNAYITIKYIIIRDEITLQMAKARLDGKQIHALHACPPSGLQVFTIERLAAPEHTEETRSFTQALRRGVCLGCC